MEQHHLTIGAHLLLWGFPLVLTLWAVLSAVLDARSREISR